MKRPPALKKSDTIGLVAPARKIRKSEIEAALSIIVRNGFTVYYTDDLFATDDQFAGDDAKRSQYFQQMLDDDSVRAIMAVRGGYGSVRIIDRLDFGRFKKHPKWIIGFSDLTVFHSHINKNFGIETLHASMPLSFTGNTKDAMATMFDILKGNSPRYTLTNHPLNRNGYANGILCGGNLSVLYSLSGSTSFPDTKGKILFIEDLDEYLYHIDRMIRALKRAGVFDGLKGVIVGGMTDMNDNEIPFGKTAEEIIHEVLEEYDFPVCFGFQAGHIGNNLPLIMGSFVDLEVSEQVTLIF